jgi:hypothetical protein
MGCRRHHFVVIAGDSQMGGAAWAVTPGFAVIAMAVLTILATWATDKFRISRYIQVPHASRHSHRVFHSDEVLTGRCVQLSAFKTDVMIGVRRSGQVIQIPLAVRFIPHRPTRPARLRRRAAA